MNNQPDYLQIVANWVTIVGFSAVILSFVAFFIQRNTQKIEDNKVAIKESITKLEQKIHIIDAIKSQLQVIGSWTSFEGGGYKQSERANWVKDNRKARSNPFHLVYEINASYIQNINLLPGIIELGDKINGAIASLNQEITSFNCTLNDIRSFKFSQQPIFNITLERKLRDDRTLTGEEEQFSETLVALHENLHFNAIGDESSDRLHSWHRKLKIFLEDLEKETDKQISDLRKSISKSR